MKVLCYGVRDVELPYFEKLNKDFGYEITCIPEYLNSPETCAKAQGFDAVILRGNCFATKEVLDQYKSYGIKYVLTRTVGVDHIDVKYAKEIGLKTAYVPFYSPNAIAELAVTLGMMLVRNTAAMVMTTKQQNFKVLNNYFSPEIRNLTVGVVGLGRIGFTAAKLFKGLGANVLGHDLFKKEGVEDIVTQVDLDTLIAQSDVITLHAPYIKENGKLVTKEFLAKMKQGAILVNTSRGENVDTQALIDAIKSGHIAGAALDTIDGEGQVFFKDFEGKEVPNPQFKELLDLYPRVLITPHVGSFTNEALANMIETSYQNLKDLVETGSCKNEINK